MNYELVSVTGPLGAEPVSLRLEPPGPLHIGRRPTHHLFLPDPASRDHAMVVFDRSAGQWFVVDTNSRHGTRLNGVALEPQRKYPLRPQDLIEIRPWTLQLVDKDDKSHLASTLHTFEDESEAERIDRIGAGMGVRDLASDRLALLLQCAKGIHSAETEEALADAVLDAALEGTGFANAALLRPAPGAAGERDVLVSVIGHRGAIEVDAVQPRLSRSLIARAGRGEPVRLTRGLSAAAIGASIVDLGIDEALCVPLMLGGAVGGFLYLDSRQNDSHRRIAPDAADLAVHIAQLAAMAMANFRRRELEQRLSKIESELKVTAEAQRWILPGKNGSFGCCWWNGESRPGHTVSGDFYDVVPLDEHRFAVTLGDVVGKGIAASVLMTAAQGFLHAALRVSADCGAAVNRLNRYISPRCSDKHFLTLWVGVFNIAERSVNYVDAGHGYGVLLRAGCAPRLLREGGGPPVGIDEYSEFEAASAPIESGDRILVVSDGLVEQPSRSNADGRSEQFGLERITQVVAANGGSGGGGAGEGIIAAIFKDLLDHAGGSSLADDATVVLVGVD